MGVQFLDVSEHAHRANGAHGWLGRLRTTHRGSVLYASSSEAPSAAPLLLDNAVNGDSSRLPEVYASRPPVALQDFCLEQARASEQP
jgi:hypothetical protein